MARRSFSFMLAWRYLNPRRAMLSAVTLISVTGVLLGVWILVVVMSVYNGLEHEVKNRLLGYAPHVKLEYAPGGMRTLISDWRDIAQTVALEPDVKTSAAYVEDFVVVDVDGAKNPCRFRGIDTSDRSQVEGIAQMLDTKAYPTASAEMGLDPKVVVSSNVANSFRVTIGDKIKLYSVRNAESVQAPFELTNHPPVKERFKDLLTASKSALSGGEKRGEQVFLKAEAWGKLVDLSDALLSDQDTLREGEDELFREFLSALEDVEDAEEGKLLPAEAPAQAISALTRLETANIDEMDLKALKSLRELILPQEAEIIGIFEPGKMAIMPDIFMPLPMAQQLAGLEGAVQAVAVRLDNPYDADHVAADLRAKLPDWHVTTWYSEFGDFARLISQQRVMMYIVLSMIIIISAFSMMAVMFTVTIQKRREIGVMKALGAAPGQIVRVFLHQGVILGISGSLLGVGLGLLMLRFLGAIQNALRVVGFDPFSAAFNGFDQLPVLIVPGEVVSIAIAAFVLCSLAAMVPAFVASRSDAAKSLRNL